MTYSHMLGITLSLAAALALSACGDNDGDGDNAPSGTRLQKADSTCFLNVTKGFNLVDDGHGMIIDGAKSTDSINGVLCMFEALGTSEIIQSRVSHTTSLQGLQTAEEDGLTYRWSYHPDNGLNMTVEER